MSFSKIFTTIEKVFENEENVSFQFASFDECNVNNNSLVVFDDLNNGSYKIINLEKGFKISVDFKMDSYYLYFDDINVSIVFAPLLSYSDVVEIIDKVKKDVKIYLDSKV